MTESTAISIESHSTNINNIPANKQYVFNQTGNIMLTWVGDDVNKIPEDAQKLFSDITPLFIALLKKIRSTINPKTNERYSIYNYDGIMKVIDESNAFIPVTSQDIIHETRSFGTNYNNQLLSKILGLDPLSNPEFQFAAGMLSSINNEGLRMAGQSANSDGKVGNVFFICEYLLGVAAVSVVVASCDPKLNLQTFKTNPCTKQSAINTKLIMHKETFMLSGNKL